MQGYSEYNSVHFPGRADLRIFTCICLPVIKLVQDSLKSFSMPCQDIDTLSKHFFKKVKLQTKEQDSMFV